MRTSCVWAIATAVLAGVASNALAAVVRPMTIEQQAVEADRILVGDVVSVASYWNDDRTQIRTRIKIAPSDYIKGTPRNVEVLDYIGGTVGDYTLIRTDTPVFSEGMRILLFLDGEDYMVGAFQGGYLTDGEMAVRMVSPLDTLNPAAAMPFELVLAKIARGLGSRELPPVSKYEGDYEIPFGQRYVPLGADWSYVCQPMGEDFLVNGNCADASAGSEANQIDAILAGADAWTSENLGFEFTYGGTTNLTTDANDGLNIVYFCPSGSCGMGSSTIAVTGILVSGGTNIVEWDMIFNDSEYEFWDGQTGSCSGMQDIQAVAAHEFGHALGLGHSEVNAATMWATIGPCSTAERSLHADDVAGLDFLYDINELTNDNCVDALEVTDGSIEYSTSCATTDGPDDCPDFGFPAIGQDIWFRYQATCTGTLTVSTCGTAAYDTKIAAYAGTDCGTLGASQIDCNDDFDGCSGNTSQISFAVTGGEWYLIRIGGWEASAGSGTVTISCDGVPWEDCPGDFDGNLIVNLDDLLTVIGGWGAPYVLGDLLEVIGNWGSDCS